MMKQVYLILAVLMLLCLAPMPYGYFQLVRFVAMVTFGVMAYQYYVRNKSIAATVFGVLALLFQPTYKIALGRATWNVIDVVVAALLIGLFVLEKRLEKKTAISYQPLPPQDQIKIEDNTIEFKLDGKLSPKELVYVASKEDKTLSELFEKHPEVLEGWGQMIGFHIIYLPLLIKKLKDKRVFQYRAPYLNDVELSEISIGNNFLLQYLENPSDKEKIKQGFIRTEDIHRGSDGKDKVTNRFYPLSSMSGEPLADQLHRIGKQISFEKERHNRLLESSTQSCDEWGDAECDSANFADDNFSPEEQEETINELMEEVLRKIEDEDAGTEWERLEKEIREEFERLEKADRELGNDKSHQLVSQLRNQADQVIRSKNVLMGRDVLEEITRVFFQLTMIYQCMGLIRDCSNNFGRFRWKDANRARQLVNQGMAAMANQPTVEQLQPIAAQLIGLMPDDEARNASGLLTGGPN